MLEVVFLELLWYCEVYECDCWVEFVFFGSVDYLVVVVEYCL